MHPNPTRKTKLTDLAAVQESLRDRERMSLAELNGRRLIELRQFVRQLAESNVGRTDLELRRTRYGDCVQELTESDSDYYGRLRTWLDRNTDA